MPSCSKPQAKAFLMNWPSASPSAPRNWGQSSFEVEYPEQEGDAQTDFTFSATLINNTLTAQSYSLAASAPMGWTVSFTPSGESTRVAALELEPRTHAGREHQRDAAAECGRRHL